MNHTLNSILDSPHDYRICEECDEINWYENKACHACSMELKKDCDEKSIAEVIAYAEEEKSFYQEELNFDLENAGSVTIEV